MNLGLEKYNPRARLVAMGARGKPKMKEVFFIIVCCSFKIIFSSQANATVTLWSY